ncbi:MAG: hypothetical protein KAI53_04655 [Candidatus Aenigmarchaeota archaeon]|nr:hypothetical protein [Candidatus Aenigmarchaeota archaeon]
MDIAIVIIGFLIALLSITLGIYFKSKERSSKKLVCAKLATIILFLIFIFSIIHRGDLVLLWLAVLFFGLGICIYFFGMTEMIAGYELYFKTITHEPKEKLSKTIGLVIMFFGILSMTLAGIEYLFKISEYAITLLMTGGMFFGIAKVSNAKHSMLFGVVCVVLGLLAAVIHTESVFIELGTVFLCVVGAFLLMVEMAMKQC